LKVLFVEPYVKEVDEKGLAILRPIADLSVASSTQEEALLREVRDIDALVVRSAIINSRIINAAKKLKVVASFRVGVENIEVAEATRKGVFVIRPEGANTDSVAEHTVCLMLAVVKNLLQSDSELRSGNWNVRNEAFNKTRELKGMSLGLIGLGAIGRKVAQICSVLGMDVFAFDPYASDVVFQETGAKRVSLEVLLAESEVISIHALLTKESYHLLDYEQFNMMKRGAVIVNTARGEIINPTALLEAVKEGKVAGAGLDTFEEEPPLSDVYRELFKFQNVVITPHIGGLSWEARERTMELLAKNILEVFEGKIPSNAFNPEASKNRVQM
jgi:D-3-phosphoglycerate dehydrogenase